MEQGVPLLNEISTAQHDGHIPEDDLKQPEPRRQPSRWDKFRARVLVPSVFYSPLPAYLQPGGRKRYCKNKNNPTAYLDALRGYAAFIVYLYHGWPTQRVWVLHLPIVRSFFLAGPGMVAVFLVISGYVLSYRLLRLMRNKESARLLDALSSSMFRRWLRLYGSAAVATFIAAFFVYPGWLDVNKGLGQPTFPGQMWHWFLTTVGFSNPFACIEGWIHPGVHQNPYLSQMWTIPVEFRGSITLFCFCLGCAKLSVRARMVCLWVVIFFCYWWRCVYVPEFLYGMFIAELSLNRHPERLGRPVLPTEENEKPTSRKGRWWRLSRAIASPVACVLSLVLGLLLLGQPEPPGLGELGPMPFPYLVHFIPSWYGEAAYTFWLSFGAFFVVLALDSCSFLQIPLTWTFSLYIGDLSFGIYAMHIIWTETLYRKVLLFWQAKYLGDSYAAFIPGILVTTICVLWSADYFRRLDRLVVNAARLLQTKTFVKWE